MRPFLGTFVEVGVQAESGRLADDAINAAFDAIAEVQCLMSFHDTRSDLSRLNLAGGKEVEVHLHTFRVLRLARAMTRASGGLFNCTVGGALVRQGVLPDHGAENVLDYGDAEDIELHGSRARLRRRVQVTLDGIAKGYAIDCAVSAMKSHGVIAGWVNAGGDLRVFGNMVLPVQRREAGGDYRHLGGLQEASLATSSVHAVQDTSFPAWIVSDIGTPEQGIWSVLARRAWRADALTKVASLAHRSQRAELVQKLGGRLLPVSGGD